MTDMEQHLPLRPSAFTVLAALARGPAPGVDILDHARAASPGILGPGTLYRLLRELRNDELIERTPPPAASETDDRHQHHALTPLGRAVLEAEARRLRRTLDAAGLLEQAGS